MSRWGIDWIDERLGISGIIDNYDALVDEGINMVINVMAEQHDDIRALTKRGIIYFWIPIVDYMSPRSHHIETFLSLVNLYKHKKILVHCELGMGRSAFFAIVYMMNKWKNNNVSLYEAIEKLKEIRPEVCLSPLQMEKLVEIYGDD